MTKLEQQALTLQIIQQHANDKITLPEMVAANFTKWLQQCVKQAAMEYNSRHMQQDAAQEQA